MASKNSARDFLFSYMGKFRDNAKEGDFWSYCLYMDLPFFSKRLFLKDVADAFQQVYEAFGRGEAISVAISMPPRAGKSYITTLFSSFMLGHYPGNSVMRNCVTGRLYAKFSYDTRKIVRSLKFRSIFLDIVLGDIQRVDGWYLKGSDIPAYFGAGVGGSIIGFGANMLAITDDLFKGFQDALSESANENTWLWKEGEHDSRTERNCCKIDIGTRWSNKDVIGRQEERGDYDIIVRIPALINGKSFCEEVHSTEYYLKLKETVDEAVFSAEYMQDPIELKGLLFQKDTLQWFNMEDLPQRAPVSRLAVVDTADTGKDSFSAPFAEQHGDKFYVVDVLYTTDPVEITMPELGGLIKVHRPQKMLIESNNGGRIFAVSLQREFLKGVAVDIETRFTQSNKQTRIFMNSAFIKRHFVFRADYAPNSQYAAFIENLITYLRIGSKHDDGPDSLTIFSEFIEYLGLLKLDGPKKPVSKASLGLR